MGRLVFLDTNAFRYFGIAFRDVGLSDCLRDNILVSPLSAFEVFAQLADETDGDKVLGQFRAIRNWTNPQRTGLLPWPDDMLNQLWFQRPTKDDEFRKRMEEQFNDCLAADSISALKEEAVKHRQVMDRFKLAAAQSFKDMIDLARGEKKKTVDIEEAWFRGVAKRAHAKPESKSMSEVITMLSAYFEFEQKKLKTALMSAHYNPLSRVNQNDIIDSEQLIYLGDTSLCMLTADKGFSRKVTESEQRARIVTASVSDLESARKAEGVLAKAVLLG
jgi:cysteinyl-tRNA synthetase